MKVSNTDNTVSNKLQDLTSVFTNMALSVYLTLHSCCRILDVGGKRLKSEERYSRLV